MRSFDAAERRARLGLRHALASEARAEDPVGAARAVVALHSTDPASVVLSALARQRDGDVAGVERALYEDRSLVRVMGMRRTVFVLVPEDAGLAVAACGIDVGRSERAKLLKLLAEVGEPEPDAWLTDAEGALLALLQAEGEHTAEALRGRDERLRRELVLAPGTPRETRQRVGSRMLTVLSADGRAARARPRGTWTSTQMTWTTTATWQPAAAAVLEPAAARAALARRWLAAHGPATEDDLRWWAGWGLRATRAALAGDDVVAVEVEGTPGVALADDLEPVASPAPWARLLPALDPAAMSWRERGWLLDDHGPRLHDRNGNAGPTAWVDGRIVGAWAQRPDGEVVLGLLEDVGVEARALLDAEVARLTALLGDVRIAPRARARSPLERELLEG